MYKSIKSTLSVILILSLLAPNALAGQKTIYFNQYYQEEDASPVKFYPSTGARIMKKAEHVSFVITDHLSSSSIVTDETGTNPKEMHYYPYGSTIPSLSQEESIPTERRFTGQIKDASTELYFYNARYYNPHTGRFISADTVQGPNRYAYCANNPIKFIDPSGHEEETYLPLIMKDYCSGPWLRPWKVEPMEDEFRVAEGEGIYLPIMKKGNERERALALARQWFEYYVSNPDVYYDHLSKFMDSRENYHPVRLAKSYAAHHNTRMETAIMEANPYYYGWFGEEGFITATLSKHIETGDAEKHVENIMLLMPLLIALTGDIDIDFDLVPQREGVYLYDPRKLKELMDEGYTWREAIYELAATMDGAVENIDGPIRTMQATQTGCNILHYSE